jgi:hypothetical protein
MTAKIMIYWNYVSLLRKNELHGVAHFSIEESGEGGKENYSELSSTKLSLHLTRSVVCL